MRGAVQRQKVSSALRNMTQIHRHQSIQPINQKSDKISQMSFVNIESLKEEDIRKTKLKLNANQFSTFIMPHTKQQARILKSLMLQACKKNYKTQKSSIKAKSERLKKLNPKHSNSQFTQRIKVDTALLKKVQEQTNEKVSQMKNKRNSTDLIQLQNLKKMSENNLIENLQNFIRQEHALSDYDSNFIQVISQNSKTRTQEAFPEPTFQLIQNYNRWKRQQAANKLKQTVKNKLSRRHIYRVLKQKSESLKGNAKFQSGYSSKQILQATGFSQSQKVKPLHYRLAKSSFKHFCLSTLKHNSLPFFQNQQQLKIESKAAQISSYIPTDIKEQFLSKKQIGHIEGKSFNSLNRQSLNRQGLNYQSLNIQREPNPQTSNLFQLKKPSMSQNDKKMMIKRWKSSKEKYNSQQSYTSQEGNVFRELTPWHGDYPE